MGAIDVLVKDIIDENIKKNGIRHGDLAESLNITKQNLSNKMGRNNFSTMELVEIADALDMKLILKSNDGKEYVIDYPDADKGKAKRQMTDEAKKIANEKSKATKEKNSKKIDWNIKINQENKYKIDLS